MDCELKLRIIKLNQSLVSNVKVIDVFPTLTQDGIMTSDDYSIIISHAFESEKMEKLIMLLIEKKNKKAYFSFHKALKLSHEWLAEELDKTQITEEDLNMQNNAFKNKVVTNDMIDMLRLNGNLVRRWQALAHTLGMSDQCTTILMQATVYIQDLDECVRHLINKWCAKEGQNATLGALVEALRREKFNDIADKLQATYSQ